MMNLSQLSDADLLNQTKQLAADERQVTLKVLWHLRAVEARRLHATRGWSSIFEYAVKDLLYSEAAAARRVASMRLLKAVPEVADSIEKGSLSLSTVSAVQSFLNREEKEQGKKYTQEEKRELLQSMENKSTRECQRILVAQSPASAVPPEKVRPVSSNLTEIRMVISEETHKKLEHVRALLSHQDALSSHAKLLDLLLEMALDKYDPVRKEERIQKRAENRQKSSEASGGKTSAPVSASPSSSECAPVRPATPAPELGERPEQNSRYIPVAVRREVLRRDGYQCTYVDQTTGRRCGAKTFLQLDHVRPVALGGKSEVAGLRVLCFAHNQSEAIRIFGEGKMRSFLRV